MLVNIKMTIFPCNIGIGGEEGGLSALKTCIEFCVGWDCAFVSIFQASNCMLERGTLIVF